MSDDVTWPDDGDVKRRVIAAIVSLYRHDWELLARDANERSVTHKLAEHLQRVFLDWHVDCEYNRHGDDPKRLPLTFEPAMADGSDTEARTVFPDVIVHERGSPHNLIVIEVKKFQGTLVTKDKQKIVAFAQSEDYRYRHGFMLVAGPDRLELEAYNRRSGEWEDWSGDVQHALGRV